MEGLLLVVVGAAISGVFAWAGAPPWAAALIGLVWMVYMDRH